MRNKLMYEGFSESGKWPNRRLKRPQHHYCPTVYFRHETTFNRSTRRHEITEAGIKYTMGSKVWFDLSNISNPYPTVKAWYKALDPELKKDVERIFLPVPAVSKKKRSKRIDFSSFPI